MSYIPTEHLKYLHSFKYTSSGYSFMDKQMDTFWEGFVKYLPLWLAPNVMTVMGLMGIISGYLIIASYDTTFTVQPPTLHLLLAALGIFVYQTLDATDGKQARRTNSSSPIGFLFDHGCDSLATSYIAMIVGQGIALGYSLPLLVMLLSGLNIFYIATWEEYHTHTCRTHFLNWGVTETQLLIIGVIVSTAIFGNGIWTSNIISVLGMDLSMAEIFIASNCILGVFGISVIVNSTFRHTDRPFHALCTLLPCIVMNLTLILYYYYGVFERHGFIVIVANSFMFSEVCSQILICSVTKVSV